jgi:AcrR family transcriptional regulator
MGRPAYTRLDVDERRRQLLELGAGLFARYSYDELSMAQIAREAGISKALLYHYFPSKQAFFTATLEQAAIELAEATQPDPDLPPVEQLAGSLDAYLAWVERNADAYAKLITSVGAVPEVRELVERVRDETAGRILAGIAPAGAAPPLRAAVRGWLWFMDGAVLDWLQHRDMDRQRLHGLLLGALLGAVTASGEISGLP